MDSVLVWLETIARHLDTGHLNPIELPLLHVQTTYEDDDARQKTLAVASLSALPMPMRTLLVALDELKCDVARDKCDHHDRAESVQIAALESSVSFSITTLRNLALEIVDHNETSVKALQDPDLVAAVHAIIEPCATTEWIPRLEERLKTERLLAFESAKTSTTIRPMERPSRQISTDNVHRAIQQSAAVRQRLKDLNDGPLTSLRTVHVAAERVVVATEIAPSATLSECPNSRPSTVNEITNILRRVRRTFDTLQLRNSGAVDDAVSACAKGLNSEARHLKGMPPRPQYLPKDALVQADSALQSEIKLLLGTLTVDRGALDQYLRSIKASCEAITNANARESAMTLAIHLQRWRAQLVECWTSYVSSQRSLN